jgi:hypothetical protein
MGRDKAMMPQKEEWRLLFEFSLEWGKSVAVQIKPVCDNDIQLHFQFVT